MEVHLSKSSLLKWCFLKDTCIVEVEEEHESISITFIKLFELDYMESVMEAFVVSEWIEHFEEHINWQEAIKESGLLAISVGLDGNCLVNFIKDEVKTLCLI
jgi:hypothetical protein